MDDFAKQARTVTLALRDLFDPTPLQRNDHLSKKYDADIWLKREDLSPVRSYKLRGAFTAMRKACEKNLELKHFVCASAGNHAQGVAYACRHFGVYGTIFMPVTAPQQKINKTKIFGGKWVDIILTGDYLDQALSSAKEFCAEKGAYFLSPFDDSDLILGQASVGVEILEQLGKVPDLVVLPVGGGGLASGVTRYFHSQKCQSEFCFVEPAGGASLLEALKKGRPETVSHIDSFVDGASVARFGEKTYKMLSWVNQKDVIIAPEDRICITMLEMLNVEGIVLEPAGALSIDALSVIKDKIKGKTVVCVTSGGNFDFERLPEVKERAQRYAGLKKYLILRMPQRPGALKDFLGFLGPDDDIARFEYLKKSARNFGSVLIGIETKDPDNFTKLFEKLDSCALQYRDITADESLAELIV